MQRRVRDVFPVRLRWDLIDERIAARGGTLAVTRRCRMDRATLSRWRRFGQIPADPIRFLRLAEALDLDPLLLFEFDEEGFERACRFVRRLVLYGCARRSASTLRFFDRLRRSAAESWPPASIRGSGEEVVTYRWYAHDFVHDGRNGRNFYAPIAFRAARADEGLPQVWHFSRRELSRRPAEWIPFGAVARLGDRVAIYCFSGRLETLQSRGGTAAEVWFGEGDSELRVSSLHPFHAELSLSRLPHCDPVRFECARWEGSPL